MEKLNTFVAYVHTLYLTVHRRDDEGATVVEYSLLAALLIGLCITAVNLFGTQVGSVLDKLTGRIAP